MFTLTAPFVVVHCEHGKNSCCQDLVLFCCCMLSVLYITSVIFILLFINIQNFSTKFGVDYYYYSPRMISDHWLNVRQVCKRNGANIDHSVAVRISICSFTYHEARFVPTRTTLRSLTYPHFMCNMFWARNTSLIPVLSSSLYILFSSLLSRTQIYVSYMTPCKINVAHFRTP